MKNLNVSLKPSFIFAIFLTAAYWGAMMCILFSELLWWVKAIGVAFCLLGFLILLQRYVTLMNDNAIIKIWREPDGEWYLLNRCGKIFNASLHATSIVTNYFVLLNFKVSERRLGISVPIFFDSLDKDLFRRLRVMLATTF